MAKFYRYFGEPVKGATSNNWGDHINVIPTTEKYGIWDGVRYGDPPASIQGDWSAHPEFAFVEGATDLIPYLRQQRVGTQLMPEMWGNKPNDTPVVSVAANAFRFGYDSFNVPSPTAYYIDGRSTYYVPALLAPSGTQAFSFRLLTAGTDTSSPLTPTTGEVYSTQYEDFLPSDAKFYVVAVMYNNGRGSVYPRLYWVLNIPSANYFYARRMQNQPSCYYEEVEEGDEPDMPTVPDLPNVDIGAVGVRLFQAGSFNNFISAIWGTDITSAIYKLIGDQTPYECILGMNIFPYADIAKVRGGGWWTGGSNSTIYLGNYSTGVSAPTCNQFCSVDFGDVLIPRAFNDALDFAPYTVVEVYLPFIGKVRVPTDFVMGKRLGVVYHCDVLTGGVAAFITANDEVIQVEGGSCLIQVPMTAKTADGARQAISSAASAGVSFATAGGMASKISSATPETRIALGSSVGGGIVSGVQNIENALTAKDGYSTFGNLALANGFLGLVNPVVYVHRPVPTQNTADHTYRGYMGIAADARVSLGDLSGFTRVKAINLGIAGASSEDLAEIEALLKEGVIL